ncbi:MAG: ribonuclease H-like domain-containing protein [Nannocystaceae bacterium]|nr:ribonuclease H-like domain-containing protein [Nannocystaceae bacterium]
MATVLGEEQGDAALVTFNGASFDLPLLRSRFVRHRIVAPGQPTVVDGRPHYDLLVAARRMWKGRGPDCKLSTLERLQLSVERQGDVHGSEIAEAYWGWLRDPDDPAAQALLDRIEAHNRVDLVSLAGLAAELGERLQRPRGLADMVRAADHHARQSRPARALAVLQPGLAQLRESSVVPSHASPQGGLLRDVALLAAELLRKKKAHGDAAALWAHVCRATPGHPDAHDRLAKHFEHRLRDPAAALSVAEHSTLPCPRRIARLSDKIAASGAAPVAYQTALARVSAV